METWNERLKQARLAKGLNKSELARRTGLSPPTITDWERGAIQEIKADNLMKVCAVLGTTPDYLLHGRGRGLVSRQEDTMGSNVRPAAIGEQKIPLLSYKQALDWSYSAGPVIAGGYIGWYMSDKDYAAGVFALVVADDSMSPVFAAGDHIVVDPGLKPRPGDYVVARTGQEELILAKLRITGVDAAGGDVIALLPLNEDYPTLHSHQTSLVILGTVIESMSKKTYR